MAIKIRIESPAVAQEIVAAIARVDGRMVPAALHGFTVPWTVTARIRGARFRLRYKRAGSDGDSPYEVRGVVAPLTTGGAAVRARAVVFGPYEITVLCVAFVGLAAWSAIMSDREGSRTLLAIASIFLVVAWGFNATLPRDNAHVRFLIDTLEQAVGEASRDSGSDAPTA